MRFENLNWMDVESYLAQDDRLIIILGATEQHAHLSLLTDIKIPLALADAAAQAAGVLVAPPLNFGCSPYFLAYPGTLSLRASTLMDAVEDVVRSAVGVGFKRILVLNGHGGNAPANVRLAELANQLSGIQIRWYDWWTSHSVEAVAVKYELKPAHANWVEAFPFTVVGEQPEGMKTPPRVPGMMDAQTAREVYGDGSFGGLYRASDEIMHEIFAACLKDVLELLKFD
jgi:creatinine amidohydrolase